MPTKWRSYCNHRFCDVTVTLCIGLRTSVHEICGVSPQVLLGGSTVTLKPVAMPGRRMCSGPATQAWYEREPFPSTVSQSVCVSTPLDVLSTAAAATASTSSSRRTGSSLIVRLVVAKSDISAVLLHNRRADAIISKYCENRRLVLSSTAVRPRRRQTILGLFYGTQSKVSELQFWTRVLRVFLLQVTSVQLSSVHVLWTNL